MPKLYSSADIEKTLKREGFSFVSQRGSHVKFRKTGNPVRTVIVQPGARRSRGARCAPSSANPVSTKMPLTSRPKDAS